MENSPFALHLKDNSKTCQVNPKKIDFNVKNCSRNLFGKADKENS